jgi:hypothetical protein
MEVKLCYCMHHQGVALEHMRLHGAHTAEYLRLVTLMERTQCAAYFKNTAASYAACIH